MQADLAGGRRHGGRREGRADLHAEAYFGVSKSALHKEAWECTRPPRAGGGGVHSRCFCVRLWSKRAGGPRPAPTLPIVSSQHVAPRILRPQRMAPKERAAARGAAGELLPACDSADAEGRPASAQGGAGEPRPACDSAVTAGHDAQDGGRFHAPWRCGNGSPHVLGWRSCTPQATVALIAGCPDGSESHGLRAPVRLRRPSC